MGTTADKLTYLNETKQELKQAINNLGGDITDNTTFRNYANQLQNVYDNLPKTEYQEGTEINLGKTIKGKLDYDNGVVGIGQSSQDGTPTPSQEIPIKCVTGNQSIVVSGKNLFDKSSSPVSNNGTSVTELATGIRASVTTAGSNKYSAIKIPNPSELLGKTLTISGKIEASASNNGLVRFYWLNNNTLTDLIASTISGTGGNNTFSISASFPSGSNGIAIVFSSNANGTSSVGDYVDYTDIILEEGSTATTYEPYHTPITYPISLGSNKFYNIGDYADELVYDVENDKVYLNKNVNEHTFTESENISLQSINSYGIANFFIPHSLRSVSNLALCNYFTLQTSGISVTQEEGFLWQHNGVYFRIKSSTASDVSSFKTWLNSHSVEVEYALAETNKEEITGTLKDQIKALYNSQSFNGTTILESNGDLPMIIKVRALKGE